MTVLYLEGGLAAFNEQLREALRVLRVGEERYGQRFTLRFAEDGRFHVEPEVRTGREVALLVVPGGLPNDG